MKGLKQYWLFALYNSVFIIALSWGGMGGACSIVGMMTTWNNGIKAAKAQFTNYANFGLVVAFLVLKCLSILWE